MFFVEARYHRDPGRAGAQVRYIAHREEGLTNGHRRELYGFGERFTPFVLQRLRPNGSSGVFGSIFMSR